MTTIPQAIDAESRGRRRIWAQRAAERFARLVTTFESKEVADAARDFSKASGSHRQRGWQVLRNRFADVAFLETVILRGLHPLAVWSAISCGASPFFPTERELTEDERQDAAVVHAVCAGKLPMRGLRLGRATWSMSASAHAIGRYAQRSANNDIDQVILEAHRRLLISPQASAQEMIGRSFIVPAGDGGFLCEGNLHIGHQTQARDVFHMRAVSYLNRGLIRPDQDDDSKRLLTPREGEPPLVSTLLLPVHLKRPQTGIAPNVAAHDMFTASQ
jgi:hypothetical protein